MAAVMKKIKEHENPWKDGELVKFKLHYGEHMDRTKDYVLPVTINGHRELLRFGQVHEVPKQYLQVIKNAVIQYIKSSPFDRYRNAPAGEGRPQSELLQQAHEMVNIPMYDVTEL